jgi:site-specific DNA-methyltransferase (adenine-specific)
MRKKQIGAATLYLADAFDIMPTLGEVDSIITDPPYDAKTHGNARTTRRGQIVSAIDFDSFTEEQFIEFCKNAVILAKRWVVMTCAWQHAAELQRAGLPLVRFGIWLKQDAAPQFSGDRPGTGWEAIAILHRRACHREGKMHWNGGGHHAVWVCSVERGEHPTQKPLPLLMDWVKKFSEEGEPVLDPFMGSGTTGVACLKLGRKFIGIEKREDYFELACRRIDNAQRQGNLFAPAYIQEPLL